MTTATRRTALITGASGGIGEELARIFAARGFDLVLIARSADKLGGLARELRDRHGVEADMIAVDLADPAAPSRVLADLQRARRSVDVLGNNAGFAGYGPFVESDPDEVLGMIQVNIAALTGLTRLLLPGMVERRWGRVLNVASTAAFMPGPLMSVYYATKAYVLSFSEGLHEELKGSGVTITALCPGPTRTGFQARARMEDSKLVRGREIMDARTVASAGFEGLMRGRAVVIPGRINQIQAFLPRLLPRAAVRGTVRRAQERTSR